MKFKNFYIFLVILSLFIGKEEFCFSYSSMDFSKPYAFISARRNQGRTIGVNSSYTTFETLIFPSHSQHFWPFADVRIHYLDKRNKFAGNIGGGIRFLPSFTNKIIGVNVFYDFRNHCHSHFKQIGIGFEFLGCNCSFRLNGYLPLGRKSFRTQTCCYFYPQSSYYFCCYKYADGLRGIDFEIESLITRICCIDVLAALGPYYYKGNKCHGDIYGTEYRITFRYCNTIAFNLIATNDRQYKTRVLGQLSVTLPFIGCCEEKNRLLQPVRRQELIVLSRHKFWNWNW